MRTPAISCYFGLKNWSHGPFRGGFSEDSDSSGPSVGEDEEFKLLLFAAVEEIMPKEKFTPEDVDYTHEIVPDSCTGTCQQANREPI